MEHGGHWWQPERTEQAGPEAHAPRWYRAQSDPVVGRALRMPHNNPAHPWTVAKLAAETGISRAALARRFTELVGEPPMTFLTGWRLALAADLLCEPDSTISAIAEKVGYASPFAAFFERCFPTAGRVRIQELLHVVPSDGDDVFVMYEYELLTGERHRTTPKCSRSATVRSSRLRSSSAVTTQLFSMRSRKHVADWPDE